MQEILNLTEKVQNFKKLKLDNLKFTAIIDVKRNLKIFLRKLSVTYVARYLIIDCLTYFHSTNNFILCCLVANNAFSKVSFTQMV